MNKSLLVLAGILLVFCFGFALACFRQTAGNQPASPVQIHGELIQSPGSSEPVASVDRPTDAPLKRRHPKPPSVQRRMVLAELGETSGVNASGAALPAGTRGTAADLAKTNLPSASALPLLHQALPGFTELTFSTLAAYDFTLTKEIAGTVSASADSAAKIRSQIPQEIQSLDGKKVVIQGFLLPVKMDDGLAVEFLLMRNQSMCCYGVAPKISEWITVRLAGKGVKPAMDQPIAVAGVLHVGPFEENGLLTGLYDMDGEKVITSF